MGTRTTATQNAPSIPEIISEILGCINAAKAIMSCPEALERELFGSSRLRLLSRCARVNRAWFREAVRFLWEDLRFIRRWGQRPFVVTCTQYCDPTRRRFYAFVRRASLSAVTGTEADSVIHHVRFPRLESLFLDPSNRRRLGAYFPRLQCPNLKVLVIDSGCTDLSTPSIYNVNQDDWDDSFDRIAVREVLISFPPPLTWMFRFHFPVLTPSR